jgi:membrane-associated protein
MLVTAVGTGGLVWSIGITIAGYALGSTIPGVDQYLLPAVAVIVVVSVIPIALELHRARRDARRDGGRHADRRYTLTEEDNPRW